MGKRVSPQILLDPAYRWETLRCDDSETHFKGTFWHRDELYSGERGCEKLRALFNGLNGVQSPARLDAIRHVLASLDGNFAFILQTKDYVLACVDHIRSFPLFYSLAGGGLRLSYSAQSLRDEVGLSEIDKAAELEFLMAGYVSGPNTLYSGLQQLQGGEFLLYTEGSRDVTLERYCTFFSETVNDKPEETLLEELDACLMKTFSKLVRYLDGRQAFIPLSAGYDSRLVLGFLRRLGYDNITSYTYGKKQLWEVSHARAIAKEAGVPWRYIELDNHKVKKFHFTKAREDYFRFASGLASIPFLNEYYSLSVVQSEGVLANDCVVLNGQSGDFITGSHLPARVFSAHEETPSLNSLVSCILEKHYSLWLNLKTDDNLKTMGKTALDLMGLEQDQIVPKQTLAKKYEYFEWQERQCKFVVNGQRTYDWYGLDWNLPLWSMELFFFWREIPWRHKIGQSLYKKYLTKFNPGNLFNLSLSPKKNPIPIPFILPQLIWQLAAKMINVDNDYLKRTFMDYYWVHSPYYLNKSYLSFLKDSKYHRNYISYTVMDLLRILKND